MDIDQLLERLKSELARLYGHRLKGIYLFGSRARGDAKPESDVDVAIILDDFEHTSDELHRLAPSIRNLSLEYDCVINTVPIRESQWSDAQAPLVRNLRREGVRIC